MVIKYIEMYGDEWIWPTVIAVMNYREKLLPSLYERENSDEVGNSKPSQVYHTKEEVEGAHSLVYIIHERESTCGDYK